MMSSNTSLGQANKGSKRMMQIISAHCSKNIELKLKDSINWLSPKPKENYKEYQLNNSKICAILGIKKDNKKIFDFWPIRQPLWDGLALGKSGTLYLFEAKSHLSETYSSFHAKSEVGRRLITKSICEVAKKIYKIDNDIVKDYWLKGNYQIANRLCFLQKMKENTSFALHYKQVKLVLINFVNDFSLNDKMCVKNDEIWNIHYDNIFKRMGISREKVISEGVIFINYPVNDFFLL